jgi:uncharacterized protein YjiS (DUF1127 family)
MFAFIVSVTTRCCRRRATRRALRQLDARALDDIGRSESDRQRECAKWFWQA